MNGISFRDNIQSSVIWEELKVKHWSAKDKD